MFETIGLPAPSPAEAGMLLKLLISSFLLLAVMITVRALLGRYIRKRVASMELRRRWLVYSRNALLMFMLLGLVIIWAEELRTLALSIVAIAVAFVVATKGHSPGAGCRRDSPGGPHPGAHRPARRAGAGDCVRSV